MSLFQNGYKQEVYNLLPPNKRVDKNYNRNNMVDWLWAIISTPLNWLNFKNFTDYALGSYYSNYNSGTTYAFGDRVRFKKADYESIYVGNNIGNTPDSSPAYWYKRQDSFIGASERILYWDSKLIFEYALNKWFGGTFRQPTLTSDIYIVKNGGYIPSFSVGRDVGDSVGVFRSSGAVGLTAYTTIPYDFTIMIPTALYPAGGDAEVRQFADLINSPENTYDIQTY